MRKKSHSSRTAAVVLAAVPILMIGALWSLSGEAQAAPCRSLHSPDLARILNFDMPANGKPLVGWGYIYPETVSLLPKVLHNGHKVVQLSHKGHSGSPNTPIYDCIQMDFSGKAIQLQGFLRTTDVSGFATLFMKEIGYDKAYKITLAYSDMYDQHLHGTTGWKKYSITLPYKPQARELQFGVVAVGKGQVQVSQLHLLVDGKPVWKAPEVKLPKTVQNDQFTQGSGVIIKKLSNIQISNLATLGKVWGFLKYYDPTVTSGERQWDYSLLRILPKVLRAKNRKSANAVFVQWIKKLGPVVPCNHCVHLKTKNIQLRPDLSWINDRNLLGKGLSEQLQHIRDNRRNGTQFFVTLQPQVGEPIFKHEPEYRFIRFPDAGFQLLALYRFWNMVEYWYPYRDIVGETWDQVLVDSIPRLALARTRKSYTLQMMALIARVHDTHANLWGSLKLRPPVGSCHFPVRVRFAQNQPVVTKYMDGAQASTSPLRVGDVLVKLDGTSVSTLFKKWAPYYGASNKAALKREIATYMTRGACGETTVEIRRGHHIQRLKAKRVSLDGQNLRLFTRDLPGPAFRLLSPQVAYLKLSLAKVGQIASYIKRAAGTKGFIIDIRNYPAPQKGNIGLIALVRNFYDKPTPYARFTVPDLANPGAFYWQKPVSLPAIKPHYKGKVVILVDSVTQSAAEFIAMALRAVPHSTVVGSTTAGADGNMTFIRLPGDLIGAFSGIGVFYPDKKPTQRVGIVPDVVVKPTIADIRAGRDPVLGKAIRLIVGSQVPEAKIRKMYQTSPSRSLKAH